MRKFRTPLAREITTIFVNDTFIASHISVNNNYNLLVKRTRFDEPATQTPVWFRWTIVIEFSMETGPRGISGKNGGKGKKLDRGRTLIDLFDRRESCVLAYHVILE